MKILTGKAMSRRTLLRGLGATVALPFLDAMIPGLARGQSLIKRPHRFQAVYVPNGMAMQYWTPSGQAGNFSTDRSFEEPLRLMPILGPLAPFRDRITQFSGLRASWVNVHAGASGSWLNGTDRGGETEVDIFADVSVDQLLAREFGKETQLASLQVSLDAPALAGSCSIGQSCVYTHTLSWISPTQALPMEYNPRSLFERLFGDAGSTERGARLARLHQQKSILDSVSDDLAALNRKVGPQDNVRIEQFSESIRDVERRIQMVEEQAKWIACATFWANHSTSIPFRDSEASRTKVRPAMSSESQQATEDCMNHSQKSKHWKQPRPTTLGGHMLALKGQVWHCNVCRTSSADWNAIAPAKCQGSAAARWARKAVAMAERGQEAGSGHLRMMSGDVIWCNRCGAYATWNAKGLAKPCPGPPKGVWGRARQLRNLRANLHPMTGSCLPTPIAEPLWMTPTTTTTTSASSSTNGSQATTSFSTATAPPTVATLRMQALRERIRAKEASARASV